MRVRFKDTINLIFIYPEYGMPPVWGYTAFLIPFTIFTRKKKDNRLLGELLPETCSASQKTLQQKHNCSAI